MASITHSQTISGGGISIQSPPVVRTNSGSIGLEDSLAIAKVGTLTTRTDDNTGTLTMAASHGITTGQIVDIYWAGGVQYKVTVGTVSTNSVPIDLGSGDDLPAADTAITAVVHKSINLVIDGDNAKLIAVVVETTDTTLRTAAHVQLNDVGDAEIAELDLVTNVPQVWDITGGSANPFTGNPVTYLLATQGSSSTTQSWTLKVVGVQDASP